MQFVVRLFAMHVNAHSAQPRKYLRVFRSFDLFYFVAYRLSFALFGMSFCGDSGFCVYLSHVRVWIDRLT